MLPVTREAPGSNRIPLYRTHSFRPRSDRGKMSATFSGTSTAANSKENNWLLLENQARQAVGMTDQSDRNFIMNDRDAQRLRCHTFELVLQTRQDVTQPFEHRLLNLPEPSSRCFKQSVNERVSRVRIERTQSVEHLLIKHVCRRDFIVDPVINSVRSRRPAKRVRHVMLDLGDSAEAVRQHAFKPFRIEGLGSSLEF